MTIALFVDLNRDWEFLASPRRATRMLSKWREIEPSLAAIAGLDDLVVVAQADDRDRADEVLGALLRLGRHDRRAWRVVLQAVMPGLVRASVRFCSGSVPAEEVAATVVAAAWDRIANYPLERRPKSIAANIVLDTRQVSSVRLFRHSGAETPSEDMTRDSLPIVQADPALVLVRVLDRAVRNNVVSLGDARLVALTRISGVSVEELAQDQGELGQSLRRRRMRVEASLAEAVA